MDLSEKETEQKKITVLYVDDDADDRFFFEEAIEQLKIPCKLILADSCMAMKKVISGGEKVDIIFLDINMPVIDGKQCLRQIKSEDAYKNIPVVAFTVSKSERDIDEVYGLGAHYHVVKPYAHINFIATLKIIFAMDWEKPQPIPSKEKFVINLAYT